MYETTPPNDPRGAKKANRAIRNGVVDRRAPANTALDKRHQRQALLASRAVLKVEGIPVELARGFRPLAPELVEKITDQIQKEVAAFAGPPQGRRRKLIRLAVDAAVTHFLDVVENKPSTAAGVHDLFRRMGYAEAIDAKDLDAMRASYHIATRDSWEAIRRFVRETGLPAETLASLIDAILTYIEHLTAQVTVGYVSGLQGVERTVHDARRSLLSNLLAGRPIERLEAHVTESKWTPPEEVSVLTAALEGPGDMPHLPKYGPDVLVGLRHQRLTIVAEFDEIRELATALSMMSGVEVVAVSWPVPVEEVRDAYRWTCRALDLVEMGLITAEGVIYCSEHREILWLYADLSLSRHACRDLLAPLEGETPHHRLKLAETMLLWLQTHESAPQLAERMSVHGQTIRHRLRKLKMLFGDQLSDPHRTLALLSALELTLPRWRAEMRNARRDKKKKDDD